MSKNSLIFMSAIAVAMAAGCAGTQVAAEFGGISSFEGIKWGMTPDQVQVVTARDLKKEGPTRYYMGSDMYGMACKVTFEFGLKENLRSVAVDFDLMNPDAEYEYVIKKVSEAMGQPKKNSAEKGVVWHLPDTAAVLMLTGNTEKEMKLTFIRKEKP